MTPFVPQPENRLTLPPESLPEGFDEADRSLDELLGASARQTIEPMGLRDRVFEASISALPATRQPALRLVGSVRDLRPSMVPVWRRVTWSRLAMAASVALAFCVGALMLKTSPKPISTFEVAKVGGPAVLAVKFESTSDAAAVAMSEVNGLPADSIDQLDGQMNYLLQTRDVTSLDDVRGELLTLVAALEM